MIKLFPVKFVAASAQRQRLLRVEPSELDLEKVRSIQTESLSVCRMTRIPATVLLPDGWENLTSLSNKLNAE
jgi:hypothetical protein